MDCGLFQGQKEWRERNWQDLPLPAKTIDAVILTHAHLDHSGWIPRLVKQGFHGPIYATPPTIDLCSILLPDSGHLQEEDAEFYNKTQCVEASSGVATVHAGRSAAMHDAFPSRQLRRSQTAAEWPVVPLRARGAHPRLGHGGDHVVGEWQGERSLLFTGDIGRVRDSEIAPGKVVHSGPTEGEDCDLLVMESTYGNRLHPHNDPRPEMAALIRTALQRGGCVVVPSFAVERTQKFLFLLKELMETGADPARAGARRQPDGDQGGADLPEAHRRVHAGDQGADREVRLAAGLVELLLRRYAGRLQEDQRVEVSDDHRVVERHGDRRTRAAPPDATPARSARTWCCSSDSRRRERAASPSRTARRR